MTKLLIFEIAERVGLEKHIPEHWGYLGPTEDSCQPRPTPWLFCGNNLEWTMIAAGVVLLELSLR